jgi:hypothetical protein
MKARPPIFFFASVFCSGIACGGSPPPEATVLPVAAPAKSVAVASVPADVSAVPEPATLLMFANVAKPAQALRVVGGWTNMPMPAADEAAELLTGAAIGRAIDLEKSMSVAVAADPHGKSVKPMYAISVAVVSLEDAKKALSERFKMTATSGGILKLEELKHDKPGRGDEDDEGDDSRKCELIPAFGPAATRLVCGGSDSALLMLAPYLARTATRTSFPSDLHVDVKLEPVKPMVTQGRAMLPMLVRSVLGSQAGSSAFNDILGALVGDSVDLALDLDKVSLDATLSDPSATAILSASFTGSQSVMARIATSHPERADAPPATFWHLPVDADTAFFSRGIDAKELEHPRDLIIEAVNRALDKEGVAAPDKRALTDAMKDWLALTSAPAVYAKGVDWAAVQRTAAEAKSAKAASKEDAERAALEQFAGWSIVGIDEPIAKVGNVAKEWVTVWNRPGTTKLLKSQAKDGAPATLRIQPLSKGITLPKDTLHLVLTVTHEMGVDPSEPPVDSKKKGAAPAKPKLAKPLKLHVLLVPDAGRTWVAMGADEALAAAKVTVALSTTTDATTLARRDGLDDLRSGKMSSGGFFSVRGVVSSGALGYALEKPTRSFRDPFRVLASSPQQGATPVPFSFVAQAPSPGGAGSVILSAKVPRAAIQDIVNLATH